MLDKVKLNITKENAADNLAGRIKYAARFLEDQDLRGKKILDVGCGFGWLELNAANRGCQKIVGLDPSQAAIKYASKQAKNKPQISFLLGDACDLPFPAQSFDTVIFWEVMEHLPRHTENKMFREACRVLRKKGALYLSTPNKNFLANLCDPAWYLRGHRHYAPREIISLARRNHFHLKKMAIKSGFWEILAVNNLYFAKWLFGREMFWRDYIIKRLDQEYKKAKGFVTVFAKFKKMNKKF